MGSGRFRIHHDWYCSREGEFGCRRAHGESVMGSPESQSHAKELPSLTWNRSSPSAFRGSRALPTSGLRLTARE